MHPDVELLKLELGKASLLRLMFSFFQGRLISDNYTQTPCSNRADVVSSFVSLSN